MTLSLRRLACATWLSLSLAGWAEPRLPTTLRQLMDAGKYLEALPLAQEALRADETRLGPVAPQVALSLSNLAYLYDLQGQYDLAHPLYLRALAIQEKAANPVGLAFTLNRFGILLRHRGDYPGSQAAYLRSLAIREKALGPEHPDVAACLNNLGYVYQLQSDYSKAEQAYGRALSIRQKILGPEHPEVALSMVRLADLSYRRGDYASAERVYQQALSIRQKTLAPDHPEVATLLNKMAFLYGEKGDYSTAESLYLRALAIREKALGPTHVDVAGTLNDLALLYDYQGQYERAQQLYVGALKIRENQLGAEHVLLAPILNNLGYLFAKRDDLTQAEQLCSRSLAIREKQLGPHHPDVSNSLHRLAWIHSKGGHHDLAEPLYLRAMALREKLLGPEHPDLARTLYSLACHKLDQGDRTAALAYALRCAKIRKAGAGMILSYSAERQRLAYFKSLQPYNLLATLGDNRVLHSLLHYKGEVLDSLLEDRIRAFRSPQSRQAAQQLHTLKARWGQLAVAAGDKNSVERSQLKEKIEKLEQSLGAVAQRASLTLTVPEVQAVLPPSTVLVEYANYNHYLGKQRWQRRYGAVVVTSQGEPRWLSLGGAQPIHAQLEKYRSLVGSASGRQAVRADQPSQADASVLSKLYEQLWSPIEAALPPGTRHVIVAPDGQLNFLSFATMVAPDGQFLAEKHPVSYVSSGRDLVSPRLAAPFPRGGNLVSPTPAAPFPRGRGTLALIYNPLFSQGAVADSAASTRRDLSKVGFAPLPGTEREGQMLSQLALKHNLNVQAVSQTEATVGHLRSLSSPTILHLATHGFFLPEKGEAESDSEALHLENPMVRSGLALAGAQDTLELWKHGQVPEPEQDGILTAEEASSLNLEDTWLVTLSACETGSGELSSGEGVLGLRRGFMMAGAHNLLMTLWPVADHETADLMMDFYERALASGDPPSALAEVQRDWLVRLRGAHGLAQAVRLAGPFVLTFRGRPGP